MVKLLLAATLLATAEAYPIRSGCGKTPPSSGKHSFTNQGRSRDYWIHVPKGYDQSKPTSLVVLFHGWGYSGSEWTRGTGWGSVSAAPTADANNFIIVAPTGLTDSRLKGNCDNGGGYCSWNAAGSSQSPGPEGMTCNPKKQTYDYCYRDTCTDGCKDICSWTTCNDDTTMVHALIDKMENEFCVDQSRIYAGGESNGAMTTWQMGTDSRASRFAALAANIGLPHHGYNFLPAVVPMPIIGIWGSNDRSIPAGNDRDTYSEGSDGFLYTSAKHITTDWAKAHGCSTSGNPTKYATRSDGTKGLSCTAFQSGCNDMMVKNGTAVSKKSKGAPVVDCRFTGGHNVESFVPALMWEFFSKHTRIHKN